MIGLGKLPDNFENPGGNGPPKGADEGELFAKLSQLPRPVSGPQVLRAKGVAVGTLVFHVLSAEELLNVRVEASRATEAKLGPNSKGTVAFEEVYDEHKALGLLHLACRQPGQPEFPVFPTLAGVRANLTDDEAAVVLQGYNIFRREVNPLISDMTPEEMEAWLEALERGVSRFPLSRFTSEALMDLLMYAVRTRRRVSSTATSSAGSPPDGLSTPSSGSSSE